MDNSVIISSAVYVISHAIVGIYLYFLKKTNAKAYEELLAKNEDLRKQSMAIWDLMSNPSNPPSVQHTERKNVKEAVPPSPVPMEPYTPRDDHVIYLDDLLKNKKVLINGYEISIDQTPR